MAEDPNSPLSADETALLAALQARQAAADQVARDAVDQAIRGFVASPEFKALLPIVLSANAAAPLESRIHNMAVCMTQLLSMFPA